MSVFNINALYSPRKRGYSHIRSHDFYQMEVFPAQAGVVQNVTVKQSQKSCSPRACGGGPIHSEMVEMMRKYSPIGGGGPRYGIEYREKAGYSLRRRGWSLRVLSLRT